MRALTLLPVAAALVAVAGCSSPPPATNPIGFFITSTGGPNGANFGGLAGADAHCQKLADAVGAGKKTWHAYLSASEAGGTPAVNARDRIGKGPWRNVKGEVIANSVDDLHSPNNKLGKQTSLTEKGEVVTGFGDPVNMHDILTGSRPDGTLAPAEPGKDTTCGNWTRSDGGSAIVGHHDKNGTNPDPVANASWNSSHGTRGCSVDQLKQSGSAGFLYCFAVN